MRNIMVITSFVMYGFALAKPQNEELQKFNAIAISPDIRQL